MAAKASQEGICHQCPPSVRLPANQVISLLFLAGMAQKHRLSFQYGSAQRKTDTDTHTHTQQQNTHTHTPFKEALLVYIIFTLQPLTLKLSARP